MEKEDYFLGLDLGTSSVGWAVTDTQYHLKRAKGKDLWGVRLFNEASTAAERRIKRTSRRRIEREKARKAVLKDFFADAINEVDAGFYLRMEESFLKFNEKRNDRSEGNQQPFSLFNDKDFTDKDFYEKYKTIFHLRKELLHSIEPHDVRLVFLAIYNMFGHRGHFLNSTLDPTKSESKIDIAYQEMVEALKLVNVNILESIDYDKFEKILSGRGKSRSRICEELGDFFAIEKKDKVRYSILKMLSGLKVPVKEFYNNNNEDLDEESQKKSVSFREENFEETFDEIHTIVGDEWFNALENIKTVHDIGMIANIMHGHIFLSDARVEIYEKHQQDLKQLKSLLKEYNMKGYESFFRTIDKGNYSAYVGSVYSHGKLLRRKADGRKKEDLYKTIKGLIKGIPDDNADKKDILEKIDSESFLEKQLTGSNGVIPNQVHSRELRQILKNAESYLDFLKNKDEKGLSISDKIIQLFEFQIPYYVGPLGMEFNGKKGYNCWAVPKEKDKKIGKIYPWNFYEKIDEAASRKEFIERMVRKCTYLNDKVTLPKKSLLYEKFMVLNEINTIKVNGKRLTTELKQGIFKELFGKGKKVSKKRIKEYLVSRNAMEEKWEIEGIDKDCNQSLTSIGKFYGVFGEEVYNDDNKALIEDIIYWGTLFSGDKKFIKSKIEENYGNRLNEEQLKRILGFKFEGWGKLSRDFLELQGISKETGEVNSIINFLWENQVNLMELLSDEYTFTDELNKKIISSEKPLCQWKIEDLDDMYISAPVKRMIWQTMKIVDELQTVLGYPPKRIFVEMTRSDEEKVRTVSRKEKLAKLYKKIEEEQSVWNKELELKDESYFKSRKLYLYYLQMGKCMYSGEPIDLSQLMNDNIYDLDHIYPQHYTKDDSLENNMVLVTKEENMKKGDKPIPREVQDKMYKFWLELKDKEFITDEKFSRLTRRNKEFTREEKVGFINRQIVETGQATKVITQILQQSMGDECKIVFSKARLVSDFRKKFKIPKSRIINDLHHANDAYLNIVVGNAYYVKFTNNPMNFIKQSEKNPDSEEYKYHFGRFFEQDVKNKNETAWIAKDSGCTIVTVKDTLRRNTPLVTYKVEEGHGQYFKETVYGTDKAKANSYIGIKTKDSPLNDVAEYGGKTDVATLGYCLVEYRKKNKIIRTLEELPVFLGESRSLKDENVLNYLREKFIKEGNPEAAESLNLIERFIPKQSLIKREGYYYYLGGRTNVQVYLYNAMQLKLPLNLVKYIKKIEKANSKSDYSEIDNQGEPVITVEKNQELYKILMSKFKEDPYKNRVNPINKVLENGLNTFMDIEIANQCKIIEVIILNISKSNTMNLKGIGEASSAGMCLGSMDISKLKEFKIIHQSVTGLFEIEKDLLK